jgi:hypothetical protein
LGNHQAKILTAMLYATFSDPDKVVFRAPARTNMSDRDFGCAGINRQEEEDESALHRRSSDPR